MTVGDISISSDLKACADSVSPAAATRPFTAISAGLRFLINIQETSHFFRMMDAIDAKRHEQNYQRFISTPIGAKLDAERVDYGEILSDHAALEKMPRDSLAWAYLNFLRREELNLDMLMAAEKDAMASSLTLDPSRRLYMTNGFALHDILHVLTGYGRDPIGEACLLAFTAEQFKLKGVGALAFALAMRERVRNVSVPVMAMVEEARTIAANARWLPEIDWRDYLDRPPNDSRKMLSIDTPTFYLSFASKLSAKFNKAALAS